MNSDKPLCVITLTLSKQGGGIKIIPVSDKLQTRLLIQVCILSRDLSMEIDCVWPWRWRAFVTKFWGQYGVHEDPGGPMAQLSALKRLKGWKLSNAETAWRRLKNQKVLWKVCVRSVEEPKLQWLGPYGGKH